MKEVMGEIVPQGKSSGTGGAAVDDDVAEDSQGTQMTLWEGEGRELEVRLFRNELAEAKAVAARYLLLMALAGLPRTPTKERELRRVLRLGAKAFFEVHYGSPGELPYGGLDRVALTLIQDFAISQGSQMVRLGTARELMASMGTMWTRKGKPGGSEYKRLREAFTRVCQLTVSFTEAESEAELGAGHRGGKMQIVSEWDLSNDRYAVWWVRLSDEFYRKLKVVHNQSWAPRRLIKAFSNDPLALDWTLLMVGRAVRARSISPIPHEALMGMFKDSPGEEDRRTISRLRTVHQKVIKALDGSVAAVLDEYCDQPGGKGRPKKKCRLVIEPLGEDKRLLTVKLVN